MTIPRPNPIPQGSQPDELDELGKVIESMVGRRVEGDAEAAGTRPPARSTAPRPPFLWGPSTPRITSPLQMLAEVAQHTHRLHEEMGQLLTAITGEVSPAPRLGHHPYESLGLLPAIAHLAHDIEATNLLTAKLVQHVLGKVRP